MSPREADSLARDCQALSLLNQDLKAEIADLRSDIERHMAIASQLATEVAELRAHRDRYKTALETIASGIQPWPRTVARCALASPPAADKCIWENTGNFTWTSACGNQFTSDEYGIGSDMPFCCFCGKRIDLISELES